MGVIKRAELKSQHAVEGLKNEVGALLDLKSQNVPEVYDTGEAEYGSKTYFYMVIEYIEGIRVEKHLGNFSASERKEILTQFFSLLAKAHQMGIVNGDVDLKHLFWRRDKKQLVVIDWGNSKLNVDPKKKTEFAYDLARSAEIIYSLTTRNGHPSATGSIALPNDSALVPGLTPLPVEFRSLCKWAPRTPNGSIAPLTALELFNASKRWDTVHSSLVIPFLIGILVVTLLIFFTFFNGFKMIQGFFTTITLTSTETPQSVSSDTPVASESPSPTGNPTETFTPPANLIATPSLTPIPAASTSSPRTYTNLILGFDKDSPSDNCWVNETNSPLSLKPTEGFTRRGDGNWKFGTEKGRTTDEFVQTDFSECLDVTLVDAIALNIWVPQLELQRDAPDNPDPGILEPGKEIGFFIDYENSQRREYTIWIDKNESIHLRVREGSDITVDDVVLIINEETLKISTRFPRYYAEFPIQIFFEINNNGLDIIYLRQGPVQQAVRVADLDPSQFIRIDNAVYPTIGSAQKIGLIGYGGDTQTVIWPLVFFRE